MIYEANYFGWSDCCDRGVCPGDLVRESEWGKGNAVHVDCPGDPQEQSDE